MNYSELKSNIATTLNRADLTSVIPTWIEYCEKELNRRLRTIENEIYTELDCVNGIVALPSTIQSILNIELLTTPSVLTPVGRTAYDGRTSSSGTPCTYTLQGRNIVLSPAPADQKCALRAHVNVTALSDTTTTTDTLTAYPDVYLYGSLIHSASYLKEDDRIMLWRSEFERSIDQANKAARQVARPTRLKLQANARSARAHVR